MMKELNYLKWIKYKTLADKYKDLFISDCKRELDICANEEAKRKILERLVIQ